jgi:hypothetical protein
MPEKETLRRARRDKRQGKAPSTQAGEFVREEIHHVREGKHGARSTRQVIAIGLAKARRAGVKLGPEPRSKRTGSRAKSGRAAATGKALSNQARAAAKRRSKASRHRAAVKAARTRKRRAAA